jgi:hypothetical protein
MERYNPLTQKVEPIKTFSERGEQGPQGIPGIQGVKGDKGDRGEIGPRGPQGIQGIQGDRGAKGEKGEQGIQGLKGDTGPQGLQGIPGLNGKDGAQGVPGLPGKDGINGPKIFRTKPGIPKSEIGKTNDVAFNDVGEIFFKEDGKWKFYRQIDSGVSVAQVKSLITETGGGVGQTGPAGAQGLTGPTGSAGAQGIQGVTGPAGIAGATGASGLAGQTGSSAFEIAVANGYSDTVTAWLLSLVGPTGAAGATGATGAAGATGPTGPSGVISGSNQGTGEGLIFSTLLASDLQLRTIKAGSNVTVTTTGSEITIASTGGGGGSTTTVSAVDILFTDSATAPSTPAAGMQSLYSTAGGLSIIDSSGTKYSLPFSWSGVLLGSTVSSSISMADTGLVSAAIPAGYYQWNVVGAFQSNTTTCGFGCRFIEGTATVAENIGSWEVAQNTDSTTKNFQINQLTAAMNAASASVPIAATKYPFFGQGFVRVTVAGTMKLQFRSEVASPSQVTLSTGTSFLITKVG